MSAEEIEFKTERDRAEWEAGEWPTFITALNGLCELWFYGWSAKDGFARYKDQLGEIVPVYKMTDGRLVADIRED